MLKQNLKRANEVYYRRCAKANTNKELKARVNTFYGFTITIVLDLSWDDCNTQEKLETMITQNFGE